MKKPVAYLIGEDGNIFNLIAIASKSLKKANMPDRANEMRDRVLNSKNYSDALSIIMEYVEVR